MLQSRFWLIGLLAAGVVAAAAFSGAAGAQDTPGRSLRFAVVNMNDCIEATKNDHARDLSARFDVISKEIKDELNMIRKKADELKTQAKNLEESGPGSALYVKLFREWNLEEANLKIATELSQRKLIAARDSFKNQLYSEARKMTTVLAQEMKIDVVFRSDEGAFEEDKSDLALQKNMLRSVLYHDPSLDLTDKVLARLNEDFKKRKSSAVECPKCKIAVPNDGKCPRCGDQVKK